MGQRSQLFYKTPPLLKYWFLGTAIAHREILVHQQWKVCKPQILWKDAPSHTVIQYLIDDKWKNLVAELYLNIILYFGDFYIWSS